MRKLSGDARLTITTTLPVGLRPPLASLRPPLASLRSQLGELAAQTISGRVVANQRF